MGKIVIYLADGGHVDVMLDKERITIGRRPDNDVCLPFPAVSGEHAQFVTILADSFLEDLGSTNGTLVNGKPIAKHFLRDRDAIDIGRQRLTYFVDDKAKVDALPPDIVLRQLKGMPERVEGVKPKPKVAVSVGGRVEPLRNGPGAADLEHVLAEGVEAAGVARAAPAALQPSAQGAPSRPGGASRALSPEAVEARKDAHAAVPVEAPAAPSDAVRPAAGTASSVTPGSSVRVLSGASQGRTVAFPGAELTVGRVGVQVAVVRRLDGGGYLLIPLEGREPPRINGAPVAPEGSPLHPGDTFEVAGVRLELSVHS